MSFLDTIPRMEPLTEWRTFHGVQVGIVHGQDRAGRLTTVVIFPDEKACEVRQGGYENLDEAIAAEVAIWRIRRIRKSAENKPLDQADIFELAREAAMTEGRATEACGEQSSHGGRCYRQAGHATRYEGQNKTSQSVARCHVAVVRDPDGEIHHNVWNVRQRVIH